MEKHFTATVYIVSKINGQYKVLLHNHRKQKLWLPVGGHIEPGELPEEAAIREAEEETNLKISLIKPKAKLLKTSYVTQLMLPAAILEEKIASFEDQPIHYHIDFIFFGICKDPGGLKIKEEHGWFGLADLKNLPLGKEVVKFAKKAIKKTRNYV